MAGNAGHYTFGTSGNALPLMSGGWSTLEPGFSWTEGAEARIRLQPTPGTGRLSVDIALKPYLAYPVLRHQRLVITCNGIGLCDEMLGGDITLGLDIPPACLQRGAWLEFVLSCPDATAPCKVSNTTDTRKLGFALVEMLLLWTDPRPAFTPKMRPSIPADADAVRGLTGLSITALAEQFESLGRNCEFGLAQRGMGAEPLGLLRFSSMPPTKLLEALDLGFEGIEQPDNLLAYTNDNEPGSEFLVRDERYGMQFHSNMTRGKVTAEAVLTHASRSLAFLRRKLLEDLTSGGKIFVFQNPASATLAQARPLLNMLRSYGQGQCMLLYVSEGAPADAGVVRQIEEDLLHGTVARLAPAHDVAQLDLAPWIAVCANAYRLWRESDVGSSALQRASAAAAR